MSDPLLQLRSATRRAKSDVANKVVSMFLHEFSRMVAKSWPVRLESDAYIEQVRETFGSDCPYCGTDLLKTSAVVEHLDGMNRLRVGLHVAGNVLIACRSCNNEKRRDDSMAVLTLAETGWESFLCHSGACPPGCRTCAYWTVRWPDLRERRDKLLMALTRLRDFREKFPAFVEVRREISRDLPKVVGKLYGDCQAFAQDEIARLLQDYRDGMPSEP
jgi:hypothetical protein